MKKLFLILFFLYIFILISCSREFLLNDANVVDFQSISNHILEDGNIVLVERNLDDTEMLFAKNPKGEEIALDDVFYQFFQRNKKLGIVYKDIKHLETLVENNSPNVMLSDSVLKMERGARQLLKRLPDGKSYVTMVSFRRFSYIPILGNTLDGDRYVYSPDLSLDVLASEELSVFGFKCAIKTNYENWFYTTPLG